MRGGLFLGAIGKFAGDPGVVGPGDPPSAIRYAEFA
jgi:hypothetical protein